MPRTITVTSNEIATALQEPLAGVVGVIRSVLEKMPPELSADVIDRGIVLTGGGALLRNVDRLLTEETGIPCHIADRPLDCVAEGATIALEYIDVIRRSLPSDEGILAGRLRPSGRGAGGAGVGMRSAGRCERGARAVGRPAPRAGVRDPV